MLLHEIGHLLGVDPQIPGFVAHVGMLAGSAVFADGGVSATFVPQADDLDPNLYPNDLMSLNLAPGVRRLPSPLDVQIIDAVRSTSLPKSPSGIIPDSGTAVSGTTGDSAFPLSSQPARGGGTDNDGFINGNFSITDPADPNFGWTERSVGVSDGQGVLSENPNVFSGLTQTFTIPTGATALQFIVYPNLVSNGPLYPPDAFEAALLDPTSGNSLVGRANGLTLTDAFFNVQTSGQTFFGPQTTEVGLSTSGQTATAGSPEIVTVSLAGLTAGSQATLDLVLLGASARPAAPCDCPTCRFSVPGGPPSPGGQSRQLLDAPGPVAGVVSGGRRPGQRQRPAERSAFRQLVNGPADGTLQLNPDGSFTYTPNQGFSGPDSFTYEASNGRSSVSRPR